MGKGGSRVRTRTRGSLLVHSCACVNLGSQNGGEINHNMGASVARILYVAHPKQNETGHYDLSKS